MARMLSHARHSQAPGEFTIAPIGAIRKLLAQVEILTSPIFIISVMLALMGFQAILMCLIAELLVRTYHESQSKPTYRIRAILESK